MTMIKEMTQMIDTGTFKPLDPSKMTSEEKREALMALFNLKVKRDKSIKVRVLADGRKQRKKAIPGAASSPTVSLEALLLTCVVDAAEGRDVAITDIPGAYLSADMDKIVNLKLEGSLAEIMAQIAPEMYSEYVHVGRNNKKVVYMRIKKALYGCLQSALLFYNKLAGDLISKGFKINFYDSCVANKMVKGNQMTICWHVDDLKISHVDPREVTKMIEWLESKYGKMRTTRGRYHDYLGMDLDFRSKGSVAIRMEKYLADTIKEFPEEIVGGAATPAAYHLYMVGGDDKRLGEARAKAFHRCVARLLFMCKRSRPDIQQAISFLTKRVREPTDADWKKLMRLLRFLNVTRKECLTLSMDDAKIVKWWVDGSFAVHPDMKSQTGATMSLGRGSVYSTSVTQRLNTKSSTETELVAVDDIMPQLLWTMYFLGEQGYTVGKSRLYQDNKSTILLEKNGRRSSGKRTRHINIRYYFIHDRVKAGEVDIEHCPTEDMWGDFFTKPLQGKKFRRFQAQILGKEPPDERKEASTPRSVLDLVQKPDVRKGILRNIGPAAGTTGRRGSGTGVKGDRARVKSRRSSYASRAGESSSVPRRRTKRVLWVKKYTRVFSVRCEAEKPHNFFKV